MSKITAILLITCVVTMFSVSGNAQDNIKNPNVAHRFYSGDPQQLSSHIERLLSNAKIKPFKSHVDIIIAPHAGYVYSGQTAAYGFKAASLNHYNTVLIIGPSHFYQTDGISIWASGGYKTPLGVANIDEEFAAKLLEVDERISFDKKIFDKEHSVEVEIPFVQTVFKGAKIIPIIMGGIDLKLAVKFSKALNEIIGSRRDVLIVISSDMSHFHPSKKAEELDRNAIKAMVSQDIEEIIRNNNKTMAIDGVYPVLTAILYAKERQLRFGELLHYEHSGHVTGDMEKVVGYASILYHDKKPIIHEKDVDSKLTLQQKKRLVEIARKSVDLYVKKKKIYQVSSKDIKNFSTENGAFVTLHKNKELRGCIGHIVSSQPLAELVRDMAISAATEDPRFKPVTSDELNLLEVEVSVLSKPKVINNIDDIVLGKHGVLISKGNANRGVFLPQVADETGWTKEKFLSVLSSQKAGLPPDAWKDPSVKLEVFTANVFDENDVGLK